MIINEVLCTAIYRIHANAADNLFYVLNNFYNEEEITDAKKILWDNAPHDKIGEFQRRNNNYRRPAKSEHCMDIIKAIQKLDAADSLPKNVAAQNLDRIPPMLPEELNMMMLLERVSKLEKCREIHNEMIIQMGIEIMEIHDSSKPGDTTTDDMTNNGSQNHNAAIGDSNRGISTQVPQITVTPPSPPVEQSVNNPTVNSNVNSDGISNSNAMTAGDAASSIINNNIQQTNGDQHSGRQRPPPISGQRWGPQGNNVINQSGSNGNANNGAQANNLSPVGHNSAGQRRQRSSSSSSTTQWGNQQQRPYNQGGHRRGQYNRWGGNRGSAYNPRMSQPPRAFSQNRNNNRQDDDGWTQVMSRSRRRKIYGNGTSSAELEGAPFPIRKIWVSRVHNGNIQKVERYMTNKNIECHEIEQVSNVNSVYSSYKITVPITALDNVFDRSFWPPGVRCQMWRDPRIPRDMDSDDGVNNSSTNRNNGFWNY